jgi:hypothetical protein
LAAEIGDHSPQLLGAFGYAIEILTVLEQYETAALLVGSARAGALTVLRQMTSPPDRRQRTSSPVRAALGDERFDALTAQGARLSLDELKTWVVATIDDLIDE